MKPIWVMIIFMWCVILLLNRENIQQRDKLISLQTAKATQWQQIRLNNNDIVELKGRKCELPIDHARIETNVNLIGGKVFTNWGKASDLYADRKE